MVNPLKKRYCQGTERAASINLTTKAPKDQKNPAIKTINIAKLVLSLGINYFISKSVTILKSVIIPLSRIDNLNTFFSLSAIIFFAPKSPSIL